MDEVAQADFRTDAERVECGRVLPRAEVARVAFLLAEETAAGKPDGEIRGSASGEVPGQPTGQLADRSPAAEWPEPDGGRGFIRNMCGDWWWGGDSRVIGLPGLQAIEEDLAGAVGIELLIWLFSILSCLLQSGAILFFPPAMGRRRWHAANSLGRLRTAADDLSRPTLPKIGSGGGCICENL